MSQTFRELTLDPPALTGRINRGLFADMIRPPVSTDRRGMAASVVPAIDMRPRTPIARISPKLIFSCRFTVCRPWRVLSQATLGS